MIEYIVIGLTALALLKCKPAGVGKVVRRKKRTIYEELAEAQQKGIDFDSIYDPDYKDTLLRLASKYHFDKQNTTRRNGDTYTTAEQYFDNLKRAYKVISGVGATTLPFTESKVYNANGDLILTYNDYGTAEQQMHDAINFVESINTPIRNAQNAYWRTICYIASGYKFIWKSAKHGERDEYCVDTLFAYDGGKYGFARTGNAERKARVSYLGTAKNGALSLTAFVHNLWQADQGGVEVADTTTIMGGVEDAIRSCNSVGAARKEVMQEYLSAHQQQESNLYEDVPF